MKVVSVHTVVLDVAVRCYFTLTAAIRLVSNREELVVGFVLPWVSPVRLHSVCPYPLIDETWCRQEALQTILRTETHSSPSSAAESNHIYVLIWM